MLSLIDEDEIIESESPSFSLNSHYLYPLASAFHGPPSPDRPTHRGMFFLVHVFTGMTTAGKDTRENFVV